MSVCPFCGERIKTKTIGEVGSFLRCRTCKIYSQIVSVSPLIAANLKNLSSPEQLIPIKYDTGAEFSCRIGRIDVEYPSGYSPTRSKFPNGQFLVFTIEVTNSREDVGKFKYKLLQLEDVKGNVYELLEPKAMAEIWKAYDFSSTIIGEDFQPKEARNYILAFDVHPTSVHNIMLKNNAVSKGFGNK